MDTSRLWPKNFSKRDEVDYLTVEYFESSWNLENLELECGPAQPDLLGLFSNQWSNLVGTFPPNLIKIVSFIFICVFFTHICLIVTVVFQLSNSTALIYFCCSFSNNFLNTIQSTLGKFQNVSKGWSHKNIWGLFWFYKFYTKLLCNKLNPFHYLL